jgi:hypothetical protein
MDSQFGSFASEGNDGFEDSDVPWFALRRPALAPGDTVLEPGRRGQASYLSCFFLPPQFLAIKSPPNRLPLCDIAETSGTIYRNVADFKGRSNCADPGDAQILDFMMQQTCTHPRRCRRLTKTTLALHRRQASAAEHG